MTNRLLATFLLDWNLQNRGVYLFTTKLLIDYGSKIIVMFSLMILMLSANKVGFLQWITQPIRHIKSAKTIYLLWFLLASIITALVPDTVAATILIPVAVLFAEREGLNKLYMLLSISIGCSAGSDFTYFGGGDNLVSWAMLEKYMGHPLTMVIWAKLFWIPTILGLVLSGFILWRFVFDNTRTSTSNTGIHIVVDWRFFYSTLFLVLGIGFAVTKGGEWTVAVLAILSILTAGLSPVDLKKLPFKAIYVWAGALVIGTLLDSVFKQYLKFDLPTNNTFLIVAILILVLGAVTNIMTNTGLTVITLPIIFALNSSDQIWLYVISVKAISLAYVTIFADGCYAVAAGYGLPQQKLFRTGILILIPQALIFYLYFVMTRGWIHL